ncbi:uncharacterized protein [Euwallacea similis]|uniref:uncharacterized protein n=1 Tax=Euwallacea similis TaxID=1736056 RepID=UPI00344B1F58
MGFLKYLLPYAICAVALMYFQGDFVFAANSCITCTNGKQDNLTTNSSYCDDNKLEEKNVTHLHCNTQNKSTSCGGYSYKMDNKLFVYRGCDIDCDKQKLFPKTSSEVVCKSCQTDNCNTFNLTYTASSTQIGYSIIPLVFSVVLAMYPN